ncbi:hypothetical protein LCGC14_0389520 [marine sediment metagenome]|uniref:Uncharacterized protein n=1 Tax=marine sediment metagenome TaxID=412755 RepID=A0A0F9T007_9ZZZZ
MSGGGGEPQQSTSTTTQQLSPEQRAILEPLIPIFTEFGQTPLQQFPGSQVVPFNPTELASQEQARGAATAAAGPIGQANLFSQFLQGPALFPESNPALRANIEAAIRPLTESFTQSILPNIRTAENLAGQVGGSRGGLAEQSATNALLRQIGETSQGLVGQNFENALRVGAQSLAFTPSLLSSSLFPAQTLAGVGGAERALTEAELFEQAQRFGAEQLAEFAPAAAAANIAVGLPGGSTTSVGTVTGGGGTSPFQGFISGGALGTAMFPSNPAVGGGVGALAGLLLSQF